MFHKFLAVFTIYCIFINTRCAALECFSSNDDNFRCHFGTLTPYRYIANYNDSQFRFPECREKKIWLIIRHGTRFPGEKDTARMIEKLPLLQQQILKHHTHNKSKISPEVIEEFKSWRLNLNRDDVMKLSEEGERELIDLAERFQSRFPTLLPEAYSNYTYKFKHTPTQRTEESAKHFTLGLFGRQTSQQVSYLPTEKKDIILRSYKHCRRWQSEVNNNPVANEQPYLFTKSKIVNDTLDELSELLGIKIDYDTAKLIYSTCRYETAWLEDVNSPWCKFLSLNNFKVMEYAADLAYFWIDGHGFNLTYKQVCPTFVDMFQFFQSVTNQKATIYFTHSGTVLKLLSFLGLAKDATQLTHDSFKLHGEDRAWRISRIGTFATNIGFILYECEKDGPSILVMHQERIVQIPGCPQNSPCPLSIIRATFADIINECDFEKICKL